MAGFEGNAELVSFDFKFFHERSHPCGNRSEIMVVELLVLAGSVPHEGASGEHEVGAGGIKVLIHQKIFLFPAEVGINPLYFGVKQLADWNSRIAHGLQRLLERSLVVERFAGVGDEHGGDAKGVVLNEHR